MEVKDFIKTTLKELHEALEESRVELDRKISLTNVALRVKDHGRYGLVEFDLAVEAGQRKTAGGNGGVKVSVVEAHWGKDGESISSAISRIKFMVEAEL